MDIPNFFVIDYLILQEKEEPSTYKTKHPFAYYFIVTSKKVL
jgi:hypothetical protein